MKIRKIDERREDLFKFYKYVNQCKKCGGDYGIDEEAIDNDYCPDCIRDMRLKL